MHEIPKHLKELRKKKDISVRALAEEINISHNTIASYERSQIVPTITNALKICEYFNVPIEYLLYGETVVSKFNDNSLMRLFKEVDEFKEEDKETVKKYLKRFVKNVRERRELEEEADK